MERTELLQRIAGGEFVISVQIDPPTELTPRPFLDKIHKLRSIGVKLVDINSRTIISQDSISLAIALRQEGLDVIPHITSRPASVNGLLDQVRSAYALFGIKNYLVVTGDPYRSSESGGVFETNSSGMISVFSHHFRDQEDILDIAFGAAINQNNNNLELEGEKTLTKIEAGVDFFMSQPVFDEYQVQGLIDFHKRFSSKPLLVGIWPLIYPAMIEKIRNRDISGVVIPDDMYYRTKEQQDGRLQSWGLTQAGYLIESLQNNPDVGGVYIVAPARNPLHLTELLQRVLT